MESSELARAADRAAAAPFIDQPAKPWWFSPAAGLWWGGLALAVHLFIHGQAAAGSSLVAVLVVTQIAALTWLRGRSGVWPRSEAAPPEIKRARLVLYLGFAVALVVVALAWLALGWLVGVVVAVVVTALLHAGYETRLHPRAATRVRMRLA